MSPFCRVIAPFANIRPDIPTVPKTAISTRKRQLKMSFSTRFSSFSKKLSDSCSGGGAATAGPCRRRVQNGVGRE